MINCSFLSILLISFLILLLICNSNFYVLQALEVNFILIYHFFQDHLLFYKDILASSNFIFNAISFYKLINSYIRVVQYFLFLVYSSFYCFNIFLNIII